MHRLITMKDMSLEEVERNAEAAQRWAERGCATRDICNRCGKYYEDESPKCVNVKLHKEQP